MTILPIVVSVKFDTAANKLTVEFEGAAPKEYTQAQKAQYILDTNRPADVAAMGW